MDLYKSMEKDIYGFIGSAGLLICSSMFDFMPGGIILPLGLSALSGGMLLSEFKANKWEKIFNNCGLKNKDNQYPILVMESKNSIGDKFVFKLPHGLCYEDFKKMKSELQTSLGKNLIIECANNFNVIMQIFNVKYKTVYRPFWSLSDGKTGMCFPVGIELTSEGEREVLLDLESQSHVLIGGITGSGKTSFLKCLLTVMCLRDVELKILDMKMGGDYNVFKYYKYLTAFVKNVDAAEAEIENVKKIMSNRFKELDRCNCKDYRDYNKKYDDGMKPIVMLIEEYTMLSDDKAFNKDLNILLAQSRAVNIKIILSIQRPCHENLNTKLKANLNHTVAFMVKNTYNSEILLDKGDYRAVTELHGKGEAILSNENTDVMFKSYFLEDREIKKLISSKMNYNRERSAVILKPKTEVVKKAQEVSLCD